jgi:hypothetical protein
MPLQNRVDPWGSIQVHPSRAAKVMGNRGILHNDAREIVKRWATKSWVACDPSYRGISRKPLFKTGSYTELFFLDEATALSAGHRPCAYCQRPRYNAFKAAWASTLQRSAETSTLSIKDIDAVLHTERAVRGGEKVAHLATVAALPEGTIFEHSGSAYLRHRGKTWRWSFDGYTEVEQLPANTEVMVLTPKSVVRLLEHGFQAAVHPSAEA